MTASKHNTMAIIGPVKNTKKSHYLDCVYVTTGQVQLQHQKEKSCRGSKLISAIEYLKEECVIITQPILWQKIYSSPILHSRLSCFTDLCRIHEDESCLLWIEAGMFLCKLIGC